MSLQDHPDGQFDGCLRREVVKGRWPLGFLVIGPAFIAQPVRLAYQ